MLLPDRHRRARPEDAADGARPGPHAARARRSQFAGLPRHGEDAELLATTTSSAPPRSATTAPARSCGGAWIAAGDIYLDRYSGWYSVRAGGLFRRERDNARRRRRAARAARLAGRMGGGGELLLPPLGLSGPAARALRGESGLHRAAGAAERGGELRQGRAEGPVDLAHHLRLGRPRARRPAARDVRLGRRADQLHHRRRLSRRERAALALLAGRPARDRQGHRALPRRLLAGVPDVGGDRRCRSASSRTASCSIAGRRCRSRSATSSIPSPWPRITASTRCATSSCARCRSGRTAPTATRRSSTASTPTSPTISATWRSARSR